jgi:hypothetical protein
MPVALASYTSCYWYNEGAIQGSIMDSLTPIEQQKQALQIVINIIQVNKHNSTEFVNHDLKRLGAEKLAEYKTLHNMQDYLNGLLLAL